MIRLHNLLHKINTTPMMRLHLGVLLLGVSGLFAKLIELPALDIIAYRSLLTIVLLFVFLKLTKVAITLNSWRDYRIALLLGILAASHWLCYFISIQKTSVAIGMLTLYTYPVMTVVIEPLLRKQLPNGRDLLISLITLAAISLLFPNLWSSHVEMANDYSIGVVFGLISALCFALRNIAIQHLFSHYSGTQNMFYQFLVTALLLTPFISTAAADVSVNDWQNLIIFTAFFSAAPHILFAGSLKHIKAKTAGLIACLQPLYGIILSLIILAEVPSIMTLVGGAIILSAAIYETKNAGKQTK